MISSTLIAAMAFTPPATSEIHPLGCSHAYLPEYDVLGGLTASLQGSETWPGPASQAIKERADEPNLVNPRQLTFGGQNAEAYWSKDGKTIIFQTRQALWPDEQIVRMNADGSNKTLISTGKGRCTCSYFTPDLKHVYFSSTHEKNEGAQAPLDMSKGYLWKVNPEFSLYRQSNTGNIANDKPELLLSRDGYIAETTIAPNGKYITFTGDFEGDIDIYRADMNGKNIKKLTTDEGYDGGPFVSWDSKKIVFRRDSIDTEEERMDYRRLHAENLVRPSKLEIWVMDADGRNKKQVTKLGCASFAPFILPDNKRIIFSSNYGDPKGREFDLFTINLDGTDLKRITNSPDFDGFPMITRDGKKLVWASNRNGKVRGETNVFVADWVN
ncbi:WD40-like Beta Propeller [Fimbriimonadaceae bacterium]